MKFSLIYCECQLVVAVSANSGSLLGSTEDVSCKMRMITDLPSLESFLRPPKKA